MKKAICVIIFLCSTDPVLAAELDARLEWSRRVELTMPVSGIVVTAPVPAGARVAKDQVLMTLEPTPFRAAVAEAEARATRARIARDEETRDAKQAQELYDRTVLSTVELENARNKLARATAHYQEAQAALEQARYRLRVSSLRAPFDARVLSRRVEVGQTLAAELQPPVVMTIAAGEEYLAQTRLSAERVGAFKPGQALQVRVADKPYAAQVRAINFEPTAGKEPYLLDVVLTTSDALHAGQAARITVP